jgi:hypothetical protein
MFQGINRVGAKLIRAAAGRARSGRGRVGAIIKWNGGGAPPPWGVDGITILSLPAQLLAAQLLPAQLLPAQLLPAQLLPAQLLPAQLLPAQLLWLNLSTTYCGLM